MSETEVKTPLREVRLRVAIAFTVIMMSSDSLNPVKVICSIIGVDSFWVAIASGLIFIMISCANAKELTYFSVKVFFHSVMNIFFSSIEVLGRQNVPAHGPVIFTGNHMNQFIDGAIIVITNPRSVGFLVAEKSMRKPVIGEFSRACGAIPVARPQDKAKPGPGKLYLDGLRVIGEGTAFTKLNDGEKIRPGRSAEMYKVKQVISDTEALLSNGDGNPLSEQCQGVNNWVTYDVLEYVDQSAMFDTVHDALANGKCLGIFPEGGSHDRTDLLPLKAGVAAITLGAQDKHDISVPIIPVGLTYFRGHRFRGRVVVEFGQPINISAKTSELYRQSKRKGYQSLLQQVEDGMRSVLVTAPDYAELKLLHTLRRLYQPNATSPASMSTAAKQDLTRRFAAGYKVLKEKYGTDDNFPDDLKTLKRQMEEYQDALDQWGLRDYQLQHTHLQLSYSKMLYTFLHGAIVLSLASIPSLLLNAPVGIAANYFASTEAKKDLKASRVKLAARDVLLSKKVLFSLVAVPILWVTYTLLLLLFSPLEKRTVFVLFLCCPLFSYMGVMAVEASIVDLKDLRPAFLRLLPAFQKVAHSLPKKRAALQKQVRAMVEKYGPSVGAIYFDKTDSWDPLRNANNNNSNNMNNNNDNSNNINAQILSSSAVTADQQKEQQKEQQQEQQQQPRDDNVSQPGAPSSQEGTAGKSKGGEERASTPDELSRPTSLDRIASSIATTFSDQDQESIIRSATPPPHASTATTKKNQ